jgi:hypothetical protein
LVLRLWFAKAVADFNNFADKDGLTASIGNGFIMAWVSYAFYAVPLVCSMAKLHVSTTAAGKV